MMVSVQEKERTAQSEKLKAGRRMATIAGWVCWLPLAFRVD
jgi:hypothetical protein